ncbi:MAG TPA: hypothetical protein DCL54_12495 [Alphaproteobacteria bacterium]|nr:hypothetical protein [Alphaproteobacteria bacterium]HAJ47388.1 hypothetical protein [Alphaproteobacteria bacterium]
MGVAANRASGDMARHIGRFGASLVWAVLALIALAAGMQSPALAQPSKPEAYGSAPTLLLSAGRPGVRVKVNRQGPFEFLIDTAASHTVVAPSLLQQLNLTPQTGTTVFAITVQGRVETRYVPIASIITAGVQVKDLLGISLELPGDLPVKGVLAADFLSNFMVDLDLRSQELRFYPPSANLRPFRSGYVKGQFNEYGFIMLPAEVDGHRATAFLDTGAQKSIANESLGRLLARRGVRIDETVSLQLKGVQGTRLATEGREVRQIKLGPIRWNSREILVSELPVFEQIGLGQTPALLIGIDMLRSRRVILDYERARVAVEPLLDPETAAQRRRP